MESMTSHSDASSVTATRPDPPKGNLLEHAIVLVFVLLLVGLGVRSVLTGDNRYGWGTFSSQVNWDPMYYWVTRDGVEIIHWPGEELRGEARKKIDSRRPKSSRYAFGGMKSWMRAYVRWMYDHRNEYGPRTDVVGFRAVVYYRINMNRRLGGVWGTQNKMTIYGRASSRRKHAAIDAAWQELIIEYPPPRASDGV